MPNANDAAASTTIPVDVRPDGGRAARARPAADVAGVGGRARALRASFAILLAGSTFWLLASARVPCAFAKLTGLPCPGCGSTRAMLALAHGDVGAALRSNPLAPALSALVLVLTLQVIHATATTGTLGGGGGRLSAFISRGIVLVAILEVVVWLARFAGFLGGPVAV